MIARDRIIITMVVVTAVIKDVGGPIAGVIKNLKYAIIVVKKVISLVNVERKNETEMRKLPAK